MKKNEKSYTLLPGQIEVSIGQPVVWKTLQLEDLLTLSTPVRYLGKVVGLKATTDTSIGVFPADEVVFGTPHGIVTWVRMEQLEAPTSKDLKELAALEELAILAKKIPYGGEVASAEIIKIKRK